MSASILLCYSLLHKPMDIFRSLLEHFQGIANALENERLAAMVFPETTGKSLSGEDLLMKFLACHLPQRCQIAKEGFLFDSAGNVSQQTDLMVTGDITLRLQSFHCIESCYCAICTKRELDRQACFESLENLASIPLTPESSPGLGLDSLFGARGKPRNLPLKVVFAFKGSDAEATLAHLEEFYTTHQVPVRGRPDLIIVNNCYGIVRTGEQGAVTTGGSEIPAHAFHVFGCATNEPSIGGYSLMYLLIEIQRAVAAGSQSPIDFGEYLDQLPL